MNEIENMEKLNERFNRFQNIRSRSTNTENNSNDAIYKEKDEEKGNKEYYNNENNNNRMSSSKFNHQLNSENIDLYSRGIYSQSTDQRQVPYKGLSDHMDNRKSLNEHGKDYNGDDEDDDEEEEEEEDDDLLVAPALSDLSSSMLRTSFSQQQQKIYPSSQTPNDYYLKNLAASHVSTTNTMLSNTTDGNNKSSTNNHNNNNTIMSRNSNRLLFNTLTDHTTYDNNSTNLMKNNHNMNALSKILNFKNSYSLNNADQDFIKEKGNEQIGTDQNNNNETKENIHHNNIKVTSSTSPILHQRWKNEILENNNSNGDIVSINNNHSNDNGMSTATKRTRRFIASRYSKGNAQLGPAQRSVSSPTVHNSSTYNYNSNVTRTNTNLSNNHIVTTPSIDRFSAKEAKYKNIDFGEMNPYQYAKRYNIPAEEFPMITKLYFEKQKEKATLFTPDDKVSPFKKYQKQQQERYSPTKELSSEERIMKNLNSSKKRKHVSMAPQVMTDVRANQIASKQTNEKNEYILSQPTQVQEPQYIPLKPPMMNAPSPISKNIIRINGVEYEKLELLGKGGTSKVYKIKRHQPVTSSFSNLAKGEQISSFSKTYALKKVIFDELDENSIDTFKGEIELLYKLQNKSRVVKLIDYEMLQGLLYLIMECGDYDLSLILNTRLSMPLDIDFVRYHFKEMCTCVQEVHESGVVHSDLKPANFVFVKGILKIIDFGIADVVPDHTVNIYRESQIGTPNYMAPEALIRMHNNSSFNSDQNVWKVGRPSDIWSCGCILYQMVYGKPPYASFQGKDRLLAIMNSDVKIEYPENGIGNVIVPKSVIELMRLCLKRNPEKRISISDILNKSNFLNPVIISENFANVLVKNSVQYGIKIANQNNIDQQRIEELAHDVWKRLYDLKL